MTSAGILLCFLFAPVEPLSDSEELCGTYSLYVGLRSLDANLSGLDTIEAELGPPPRGGHSMADLASTAEKLGFQTLGVHTTLHNLSQRPGRFACIAHLKHGHFVLIAKSDEAGVHVVDPPSAKVIARNVWDAAWEGDALLISTAPLLSELEVDAISLRASDAEATRRSTQTWLMVAAAILGMAAIAWVAARKRRTLFGLTSFTSESV